MEKEKEQMIPFAFRKWMGIRTVDYTVDEQDGVKRVSEAFG